MKIIWSHTADRNYRDNLDYLREEWSYKVLENFIDTLEHCIELIADNPEIGHYDNVIGCNKFLVIFIMFGTIAKNHIGIKDNLS